jgi:glutamate-1-semialdehyde 2,1-aminomutase
LSSEILSFQYQIIDMHYSKSKKIFKKAVNFIPGGVNSPVRAFKAVGGEPVFISHAEGAHLFDVDGNVFIDMINSWGPMILGHGNEDVEKSVIAALKKSPSFGAPTEIEVKMAELIVEMVPSIEMVRMVNSGTEATMSAIRVARGYTGRDKIIKFDGCYHGHGDSFLIAAGSGAVTMGSPDSPGVTRGTARDTLIAGYNDLESVEILFNNNAEQIAAIIVEPVAGNMGCVPPDPGFLEGLRNLCDRHETVLIFDEVMTGFRLARGGAQEMFGVMPDLTTLGKIIGGGFPVGAYGGKREIMERVSPNGPIYQAGTLSGNPVAMHAGFTQLNFLNTHPEVYTQLNIKTRTICDGITNNLRNLGMEYTINQVGSMFTLFFNSEQVRNFTMAKQSDLDSFGSYFNYMLSEGIYLAPSQFEALFVSTAVDQEMIDRIIEANLKSLSLLRN